MRQYELVERVARYNPAADETLLNKAYVYAMRAHGSQQRASGDPYFSHPLEVAAILTDLRLDDATIVAALLHDTIEDTETTRAEIDALFGDEIGRLVDGLTKIDKLDLVSKKAEQAENLRKLLLAVAEDVRVLLVKLADRLHNMRTLDYVRPEKRARIAEETLEIYAPLAGRMGIQWMRDELEELAFQTLHPDVFQLLQARLTDLFERSGDVIDEIVRDLGERLRASGIDAEVVGRAKRPYSIWRKMDRKAIAFEQLSDIYGFRVIVDDVVDCYRALGIVHMGWPTVPGRFKDYISTPKQNDYRSLHTTVVGPRHQRVELQIRTREMHGVAEYGIAAHAVYKDVVPGNGNGAGQNGKVVTESRAYEGLRRLIEMLTEGVTPEEFLEHTKLELFHDQVFCFTPKGRLIALPRGATAIDFAYAVHTDVGNTAISCKINGRIEPLISELNNGDEVEVITAVGQTPSAAWEGIVVTGKARAAIRRATRDEVRRQYAGLGRQVVIRAFQRAGRTYSDERLAGVLGRLGQPSVDDALAKVGRGDLSADEVLRSIYPDHKEGTVTPAPDTKGDGWFGLRKAMGLKFRVPGMAASERGESIPIRGHNSDLPVQFAPEGGAVPGDRIVGIMTPGEAITIYPIQSPTLKRFDDELERWLDVRWDIDPDNQDRFPARITLRALNEPGTLAIIAQIIGEQDANIDNIHFTGRQRDFFDMDIDIEVWNLRHLTTIISLLKSDKVVNSVKRVIG